MLKSMIFRTVLILLTGMISGSLLLFADQPGNKILSYVIWVDLDDQNKMLQGREDIVWANRTQDEIPDMWFHLYLNAFKNEKSVFFQESQTGGALGMGKKEGAWGWIDILSIKMADGTDLKPTMEFVSREKALFSDDQTVMRVFFPEPIKPGQEVRLRIAFKARIPGGISRTGYYRDSYFISQWYPKPGVYEEGKGWNCHAYHLHSEFFADFADFTVHITLPEKFVVGASGKQIGLEKARGKATHTFQQDSIHDFAWTASPHYLKVERNFIASEAVSDEEYRETAHRLQLSVEDIRLPDFKMILLIQPAHRNQIERHFDALKAGIKYYGLWYGPYPYETITMVDPPFRTGSGGMEYPTLFTAGTSLFPSRNDFFAGGPEMVIIHEFGHGYWYGLCANNEFEEAWLDEGINTYSTTKALEKAFGPSILPLYFNGIPLDGLIKLPRFHDSELGRIAGINVAELDPVLNFSWEFLHSLSYAGNVYFRAATCLETLNRLIGPETMIRALRTFHMRFRYKHPKTRDFIDSFNEVCGKDMTWFFERFLFDTLDFDYAVGSIRTYEKSQRFAGVFERNGDKIEVKAGQAAERETSGKSPEKEKRFLTEVVLRRLGEARIHPDWPLHLKVRFEDGSEETRLWDGQKRWARFILEKESKAVLAYVDPEQRWFIDSNLSNNSLKVKPERRSFLRATVRLLFWIQNVFAFMASFS